MRTFRARYGAGPAHLVAHIVAFAIAGFAIMQLLDEKRWVNFVVWFVLAALLHDVVLLPLYTVLDRLGGTVSRRLHRRLPGGPADAQPGSPRHVPLINHLRAPALISGLLLLIYFPLILGPADPQYLSATGHHPSGYLRNWLLITVTLFAASAVVYALRVWSRRRAGRGTSPA